MWSAEDRRRLAELEAEDDRLRAEHAEWNAAQLGYRVRDNTRIGGDRNDNGDSLDPNAGLNVDEPAELEPTDAAPVSDEPAPRPQLVQPEPPSTSVGDLIAVDEPNAVPGTWDDQTVDTLGQVIAAERADRDAAIAAAVAPINDRLTALERENAFLAGKVDAYRQWITELHDKVSELTTLVGNQVNDQADQSAKVLDLPADFWRRRRDDVA